MPAQQHAEPVKMPDPNFTTKIRYIMARSVNKYEISPILYCIEKDAILQIFWEQ